MIKKMLLVGGIINVIFTIFHFWLGWQIYSLEGILPGHKALMFMLNAGGILIIGYAAFASLFCIDDLVSTKLGKSTLLLAIFIYASRALEEIIISPAFSIVIFDSSLAVAAIYALALAGVMRKNTTD